MGSRPSDDQNRHEAASDQDVPTPPAAEPSGAPRPSAALNGTEAAPSALKATLAASVEPSFPVPAWRPMVTVNVALSLDGKIAAAGGSTYRFSDEVDRRRVHELRAQHEAILVGIGTVLADDPSLRVDPDLVPGGARDPIRVVLDSHHRTPVTARVVEGGTATWIYAVDEDVSEPVVNRAMGQIELIGTPPDPDHGVDMRAVLKHLGSRGIDSLLVEGGTRVLTTFLASGFVDRISIYVAPVVMGEHVPSLVFAKASRGKGPLLHYQLADAGRFGEGVLMHLLPREAPV